MASVLARRVIRTVAAEATRALRLRQTATATTPQRHRDTEVWTGCRSLCLGDSVAPFPPHRDNVPMADASDEARRATSHLRHELRTPINQIIGYGELLQDEAAEQGQESFVADLGRITLAARRLLAVVEEGLDALVRGQAAAGPSAPPAPATSGLQ